MISKFFDICYKWWFNIKFLVFVMLFLKDNIIIMLILENDLLLVYNVLCWVFICSSRIDLFDDD